MPSEFHQTSIALRGDRERGRRSLIALAVIGALLIAVGLWMILARVPLYAVSERARLQARAEVHPVDTLISGRVVSVHLPVGGKVRKGDVLLTLDATDVGLRLAEARARERGLTAQLGALAAELAVREEALASTRSLGRASQSEAQAVRTESAARAALAQREAVRADRMLEAGVVAEAEAESAKAAMAQTRAAEAARAHRMSVLEGETHRDAADRRAQNEGLRRTLAELQAQRDGTGVQVKRLDVEQDRHVVRAPIDGVLGQVRTPQVGSVVAANQTVAAVTPETELQVVADFAPAAAIGRIRPGQRARMRVTGFPWTQYGMLEATVAAVSGEVTDERLRVVLVLDEHSGPAIPRSHGLVGEVEVELEEVSPAALIARAAGQLLAQGDSR